MAAAAEGAVHGDLPRGGVQEVDELPARELGYYEAYAAGVNAYLADHDGSAASLEYAVLGLQNADYEIEPWTPVDSVSWLKAMAWDLRGNMQDEIDRALMTSRLGPKQIADLYPAYPYDRNKTIVQTGSYDELTKTWTDGSTPSQGTAGTTGTPGATGTQNATGSTQGTAGPGTTGSTAGTSSDS